MTQEEIPIEIQEILEAQQFKKEMNELALIIRASKGIPLDPESIISQLTDIKNLLERSRFPTYPMLGKNIYLRLISEFNPNAKACRKWADMEAQGLISYKGLSRAETVEMNKAPQLAPQLIGLNRQEQQTQEKRHFWNKNPRREENEFINE